MNRKLGEPCKIVLLTAVLVLVLLLPCSGLNSMFRYFAYVEAILTNKSPSLVIVYTPDAENESLTAQTVEVDWRLPNMAFETWRERTGLPETVKILKEKYTYEELPSEWFVEFQGSRVFHPPGGAQPVVRRYQLDFTREFAACLTPETEMPILVSLLKTMLQIGAGDAGQDAARQSMPCLITIEGTPLRTKTRNLNRWITLEEWEALLE